MKPTLILAVLALAPLVFAAESRAASPPTINEQPLAPPNSDLSTNSQFGNAVAIDGDTAVVGAHRAPGPTGVEWGAAMVFVRAGDKWTMQAKLTASDGSLADHFGWAVAIRGDTIVVTSSRAGNSAAYVYTRDGQSWSEQTILTPDDDHPAFGAAVAIGPTTIIVGAASVLSHSMTYRGAAYVFENSNGPWTQSQKLVADDGAINDSFAGSLALDGDTAIFGAPNRAAVYVFAKDQSTWQQQAKLTPTIPMGGFGFAVALNGDTAVIGAPDDSGPAGPDEGSAAVFTRQNSVWAEQATLHSPTGVFYGSFGWSVAVGHDTAIIGAIWENSVAGAVHVFSRTASQWNDVATVIPSDLGANDEAFGWSVAIQLNTFLTGAIFFGGPAGIDPGRAYAYRLTLPGDTNCDGIVNQNDVAPFTLALTDPFAFSARYAGCSMNQADVNGDGLTNGLDIGPFVASISP